MSNTSPDLLRNARARGDNGAALIELRRLSRAPGATGEIFDALAQLCLECGLIDEALAACEQAVGRNPALPAAWHRLGIIHMRRQNPQAARAALERAVALLPGVAVAHNNLGFALQSLGFLDEAVAQFRLAVAANPDYAEAHSNLVAVLSHGGHIDEALAHARRAIALGPDNANPYVLAALAEADRERFDEAVAWIAKMPIDARRNPAVLTALAEILFKARRHEDALAVCQDAFRLDPGNGEAHFCRGSTLAALGRHTEALAAFDTAVALMPNSADALAGKASVLLELARAPEAMALFDRARALEPGRATVLYLRAQACEFRLPDTEIAELEAMLAQPNTVPLVDRLQLHFVLGNAYLRAGENTKAFEHLHAGNRIKRSLINYDPAVAERQIPLIAAAFPASSAKTTAGNRAQAPIFVVGMPRSGTTLVEQILASHPDVHGAGESLAMLSAVKSIENARRSSFPDFVADLTPGDYQALAADYLARIGKPPEGKTRIVDKMPSNALFAGLIHRALPEARIVLCRRNPFDTGLSCYSILFSGQQNFTYDLEELGRYYRAQDALMAHWRAVLPEDRFFEIGYEDVVEDLEGWARRLIAFCGLEWSDRCLRFYESERPVRTASVLQVRKPLYRSSVGRWRQYREELAPLFAGLGTTPPE